ncbi:hypothetical protein Tco_0270953 [Tanacetum coccineum]
MELHDVSYGIEYVARPLLLFFSSENRLLWFRYQEYDLAHLKLVFEFSIYNVWKSVQYGVSNGLDTAYWGFLRVGTTFDMLGIKCSKAFPLKNTENLNNKIIKLNEELSDCETDLYNYKRGLSQVEARLKLAFKVDITDYNLSKNKYVFRISQIYEEVDVIEELELKVPSIKANDSVSASATGDANSLIVSLMDAGTSPVKRKLKDDIDVDELFNASSTKKKLLDH